MEPGRRHTNIGRVRNYGACNATQTVTVTQTLVPQFSGIYNIRYTIPASNNADVTYYGSASEMETENATTVVSGEPFVYTIQTVLSNSGSIESLNPAPSTTLVSDVQPTNFVYTFSKILPESDAGQSGSSVPAAPSLQQISTYTHTNKVLLVTFKESRPICNVSRIFGQTDPIFRNNRDAISLQNGMPCMMFLYSFDNEFLYVSTQ